MTPIIEMVPPRKTNSLPLEEENNAIEVLAVKNNNSSELIMNHDSSQLLIKVVDV